MDEFSFIERVNLKKNSAWKELYRRFYPALCNYARRITGEIQIAEDVVQDCFIRIWDGDICFKDVPSLTGYLYKMVYTKSLNALRDKGVAEMSYGEWAKEMDFVQKEDWAIEVAVEEDVVNRFYRVLEQLPPQQQQILMMSLEGAKVHEIAESLNISENSVKTQKKRAYTTVREELGVGLGYLIFLLFS